MKRAEVAFLISLLTGPTLLWARAIWNSQTTIINSFDAFSSHFKEVFGLSTSSLSIADQLLCLRQGDSSASDYTLQFRILEATCGWNEAALLAAHQQGLDLEIRAKMAIYDDDVGLERVMQKVIKISQHLTACQPEILRWGKTWIQNCLTNVPVPWLVTRISKCIPP